MAGKQVKIGILGGGGIIGAHAGGYNKIKDLCTVAAVAEANPARDEVIRKQFGPDVRIFRDYREVLRLPEIEAVDIILPHHIHMPAVIESAQAGKHVMVEKVAARNVWECDQMIEACDKAGVTLTICHDRRYHGEWMALKEIVESGVLGDIFFWKLDHNQNVVMPPNHWAHWKDGIGGGCIMSCLTHQVDALRWYGGEVKNVTCMTTVRPERMEGEFCGVVLAKMQSGALAELSINWWTRSNHLANGLWYEMVQVCGTKGEAYRMHGKGTFLNLREKTDSPLVAPLGEAVYNEFVKVPCGDWGGHERCIEQWVRQLRGEPARIITTGRDCRGTVEVAEAAYRSVDTGRTIDLPIDPRPWIPFGMPEKFQPSKDKFEYFVDLGQKK